MEPDVVDFPIQNVGFCYLLVSQQDVTVTYVGECVNLRRRFCEHNCGRGAQSAFRPYMLFAFVVGFPGDGHGTENEMSRRFFERQWHGRIGIGNARLHVSEVLNAGLQLVEEWNLENSFQLTVVQCCRVRQINRSE